NQASQANGGVTMNREAEQRNLSTADLAGAADVATAESAPGGGDVRKPAAEARAHEQARATSSSRPCSCPTQRTSFARAGLQFRQASSTIRNRRCGTPTSSLPR